MMYALAVSPTTKSSVNDFKPPPGIDLWNIKWNHDHIRLNIFCSTDLNPNLCKEYQNTVKAAFDDMAQRVRAANGNQNSWHFVPTFTTQQYEEDNAPTDSVTIKIDGSLSADACRSGDYGVTNPGKDGSFIRICARNANSNNLYRSDVIFSSAQHEGLHSLGVGHANIARDPLCSGEEVVNVTVKTCDDNLAHNFPTQKASDIDIGALSYKYGRDGPGGTSPALPIYGRFEPLKDVKNLQASPDFKQKLEVQNYNLTQSAGITPNVVWNCTQDNNCDSEQIRHYLQYSHDCIDTNPSCNQNTFSNTFNQITTIASQCSINPTTAGCPVALKTMQPAENLTAAPAENLTAAPAENLTAAPAENLTALTSEQPTSCPDGSQADGNGNCLTGPQPLAAPENTSLVSPSPATSPSPSPPTSDNLTSPSPATSTPSPLQTNQPTTCPDGSQPDAAGNCLTNASPSQPTTLAQIPATENNSETTPTCPVGEKLDDSGKCAVDKNTPSSPSNSILDTSRRSMDSTPPTETPPATEKEGQWLLFKQNQLIQPSLFW